MIILLVQVSNAIGIYQSENAVVKSADIDFSN
jgi:hypothetical protein